MSHIRSITSSEAKATLGEVLGSLAAEGPIEITRNGRPVGVLAPPDPGAQPANRTRLVALAPLYSAGAVSWRKLADETGASFGELLLELARQELPLPIVAAQRRPAQTAVFEAALRQGGQS